MNFNYLKIRKQVHILYYSLKMMGKFTFIIYQVYTGRNNFFYFDILY